MPKDSLLGVETGSPIKLVKGAHGLREAPRLWYLKAARSLKEQTLRSDGLEKAPRPRATEPKDILRRRLRLSSMWTMHAAAILGHAAPPSFGMLLTI